MRRTRSRRARVGAGEGVYCGYTSADGYCCTSRRSGITACDPHMQGAPDVYERMRLDWSTTAAALPYAYYGLAQSSWDMTPFQQNVRAWAEYANSLQKPAPPPAAAAATAVQAQQQQAAPPGKAAVFAVSSAGALTPIPINLNAGFIPQLQQQQQQVIAAVTPAVPNAPQAAVAAAPAAPVVTVVPIAPVAITAPVIAAAPAAAIAIAAPAPAAIAAQATQQGPALAQTAPAPANLPAVVQAPADAQQPAPGAQNLPATLVPAAAAVPAPAPLPIPVPAPLGGGVPVPAAIAAAVDLGNAHFATDLTPPMPDKRSLPLDKYNGFDPLVFMTGDQQFLEHKLGSQAIAARFFPGGSSDMVVPMGGNLIKYRGGLQEVAYITDLTGLSAQQWRELVKRATADESAFASLTVVQGKGARDPSTHDNDIWYLQNDPANAGAVFQAASNFNALEQPSWGAAPGWVKGFFYDHTQGPYATLCTYPATMWRRHAWAVQTGRSMPDDPGSYGGYPGVMVKRDVPGVYSGLGTTLGGWLDAAGATLQGAYDTEERMTETVADVSTGIGALDITGCDSIMRLESDDSVTFLGKPNVINQVLTSAVDNAHPRPGSFPVLSDRFVWARACLLAAYSNTLFYAWKNRIPKVFLTLVGGGVFNNAHTLITYYLLVTMRAMALHSAAQGDDFHTRMDIRLILWDGSQGSQIQGVQTTLQDAVISTIKTYHPNTHAQFLKIQ